MVGEDEGKKRAPIYNFIKKALRRSFEEGRKPLDRHLALQDLRASS